MTPLASAISRALIHSVWQGAIVGLSLWAVLSALRRHSAQGRYLAACAALVLLIAMPLVTTLVLYWQPTASLSTSADGGAMKSVSPAAPQQQMSAAAVWLSQLQLWALPLWSAGVVLFSARLMLGCKHAFQLRRRGEPAESSVVDVVTRLSRLMRVERPVRVLISSMSDSPSVVGWLRPVILLPAATLIGLTPLQLEAILAHEIGHIRRHDYLVNILQMVVETLLFYHPAVWWTSKRIRIERELCCDDLAVRYSGDAVRYARALTMLEKQRLRTPRIAMASTGGSLLFRIQRLVGASTKEYGPSRLPVALAAAIGIFCFALNVTLSRGQDPAGVKVDLGASSVIHRTPVRYPESARKQGIAGTVQVEVNVDSAGDVSDARVLSGPEELRKAALQSVLDWHFTRDAARSSRLVAISFSDQGSQVEVREPQSVQAQVMLTTDGWRLEQAKVVMARAATRAEEEQLNLLRAHRQQLEGQVRVLEQQRQSLPKFADDERIKVLFEGQIAALRAKLEEMRPPLGVSHTSVVIERTLKGIHTPGLSDAVRNDLLSVLPFREGDTVAPATREQTAIAVRSYDEHLRVRFITSDEGQIELEITAPNSRE